MEGRIDIKLRELQQETAELANKFLQIEHLIGETSGKFKHQRKGCSITYPSSRLKLNLMACEDFKKAASQSQFPPENIVISTDQDYNHSRRIANSRIDLKPCAIAYCRNAPDVAFCLNWCRENKKAFRVRSGGHHHEGMCSGNDVIIIDLSAIDNIHMTDDKLIVGPGKKLMDVYSWLDSRNMILPGGGCGNVNTGGLVQGGGWGPSARKYGLTCDSLLKATVVLANGKVVEATADNTYKDLFWALRGGGGGNFGVITEYVLQVYARTGIRTTFNIFWSKDHMLALTTSWMKLAPKFDNDITASCRLTVVDNEMPGSNKWGVLISGLYYGDKTSLLTILKPFYDIAAPADDSDIKEDPLHPGASGINSHLVFDHMSQGPGSAAPSQTCDAPHPHKVSSCFPKHTAGNMEELAKQVSGYILKSKEFKDVNTYVSLMCMGGQVSAVGPRDSAFFFRKADFIIQFQAWWSDPHNPDTAKFLAWIREFRKYISFTADGTSKHELTTGSFINFPDKTLLDDEPGPYSKEALMKIYYADNLPGLVSIKNIYDPENLFEFEMGIPANLR